MTSPTACRCSASPSSRSSALASAPPSPSRCQAARSPCRWRRDGDVGHRARVQVGLGDRVAGRAGESRQAPGWRRRRTGLVGRLSSRHRERPAQRHVAAVGHQVAVADDVCPPRCRSLGVAVFTIVSADSAPPSPSRCRVGEVTGAVEAPCARVGHRARIQVGLGDRVAGRAGELAPGARLVGVAGRSRRSPCRQSP